MAIELLLLNGPPRSGKTTLGNYICKMYTYRSMNMADQLKRSVHEMFGLISNQPQLLENVKSQPMEDLLDFTPRQMYIMFAEQFMKKKFGDQVFGKLWAMKYRRYREISNDAWPFTVVSDVGFQEEVPPMLELFKPERVLLVRLHRKGYDYKGDSRSYISNVTLQELDLINEEGNMDRMKHCMANVLDTYTAIDPPVQQPI